MAILSNKPATIAKEQGVVVTLSTSELFSSIESILPDSHWSVSNWERVEFIYKTDSQINRLLFNVHRNSLDAVMFFNEYFLEQNCECKKILIHDKVGDIFTIRRSQFSSLFGSTILFDVEVTNQQIDITPPTILSYQAPNAGTYRVGDNFDYDFTFSEPILVQGIPSVTVYNVTDSSNYLTVNYLSGSGTNVLKFRYTIESTLIPKTDILVRPLSPIQLNGGSIRDAAGNNSQLTFDSFPLGNFIFNDNLTSAITKVESTHGATNLVSPFVFRVRVWYQSPVTFTNASNLQLNATIGSTNKVLNYESHANITSEITEIIFAYTIQSGDLDTDGVTITSLNLNGATIVNSVSGLSADNTFSPVITPTTIGTAPSQEWTLQTTPSGAWNKIIYGSDKFVVVGNSDTIIYSLDGINWSSASFTDSVLSGANWKGICYSSQLNRYVAVADSGTKRVATSSDGVTWTLQDASTNATWVSVAYGAGVFSAVNNNTTGSRIMYSSDGFTWSSSGVTTGSVAIGTAYHITYENGWFLISRQNSSINESRVIKSTNGINFTNTLIESGSQNPITTEIIYGSSHFVGIANSGILRRSTDTSSWTNSSYSTLFGGITVNSFHGLTYGVRASTSTPYYYAVARSRSSSQVIYSTDQGVSWTSQTITTTTGWNSICYANGIVVAVNNGSGTASNTSQRVATFGLI